MIKQLLTALLFGLAGCGSPEGSRLAPDFTLPDLTGKTLSLSSMRGKPVLINFWASWCESCREEMPALEALHRRLSGSGAVILGVSLDENAVSVVPPFVKTHQLTFPILMADKHAADGYAVRGLPTAYLIDSEGFIAKRWVGPLDVRAVENDILALLKRRQP